MSWSLAAPKSYEFVAPRHIVFGAGRSREVGQWVQTVARRAWILPGAKALVDSGVIDEIAHRLQEAGIPSFRLP